VTNASYISSQEPGRRPPRESPPTSRSRLSSVLNLLKRNQDLLRNAGSLASTTGVTSFLGFAYWYYAAKVFSGDAVGYGTAAISAMALLSTIGMFGLGTMLIGELPRGGNRGGLMMASFIASFLGSFVLGLGFSLVTLTFTNSHFAEINATVGRMALFSFGVALTGATNVFDDSTIGLMRGGLQLSRNVTLSIAKMAALPVAALILHDAFGVGILLAWVIGTIISLIPPAITIKRSGSRILHRPDWALFWRLGKVTLAHNWLNLAITTPAKLVPVLVASLVAPSQNGAFYIASMMASFLFMVPLHMSTVLFAIVSSAPEKIAEKLRFVLRMSLSIGIPAGLAMGICAPFILSHFNSHYAGIATGPLWIMIIGYIPGLPNTVYIAVCRATGRVSQAAVFLTVFAVIQMAALEVGGRLDGLYGLSYGMLAVSIIEALITTPPVLRAAFGSVPVRFATGPVTAGQARLHEAELAEEVRLRQEAGLAALLGLATALAPSPPAQQAGPRPSASATRNSQSQERQRVQQSRGRHRHGALVETKTDLAAATDTTWWPDPDEATFRARQESGMAALIAIATHAARY
jgi:O-antigen/teichoic acid export membrane protein